MSTLMSSRTFWFVIGVLVATFVAAVPNTIKSVV